MVNNDLTAALERLDKHIVNYAAREFAMNADILHGMREARKIMASQLFPRIAGRN